MEEVGSRYLANIPWQRVPSVLRAYGVEETAIEHLSAKVLETAAMCRLAHGSMVGASESPTRPHTSPAILSETNQRLSRGRPKSARWAFWTGFLLRQNMTLGGKPPTYELLAELIGILLAPRKITDKEVRTMFVSLRREAESHAVAVAEAALQDGLKRDVSEQHFVQTFTEIEKDLFPTSQISPMVENGKINKEWLSALVRVRRAILRRVSKLGPLGGTAPRVILGQSTKLGSMTLGGSSHPGGIIHLDKSTQVPVPGLPPTGGTYGMSFPRSALLNEASAAHLYAAPAWLFEWQALFRPVPRKLQAPSAQQTEPKTPRKRTRKKV